MSNFRLDSRIIEKVMVLEADLFHKLAEALGDWILDEPKASRGITERFYPQEWPHGDIFFSMYIWWDDGVHIKPTFSHYAKEGHYLGDVPDKYLNELIGNVQIDERYRNPVKLDLDVVAMPMPTWLWVDSDSGSYSNRGTFILLREDARREAAEMQKLLKDI